ncbi:MAG: hypothetical protein HFH68_01980 [Lachnospiraceae bacterium]|nr:hypothetical protein [Lachnospiraceae bacterium]
MNKKKQVIYTAAGILFICLLFMAAVVSPGYFKNYTDRQLFNKIEYISAGYDTYEVIYTSFAEKIRAIGRITNSGTGYNSVKINDADFDYKYINKIIRKEFNVLYKCGVLQRKIRPKAKKMVSCEKYILYPSVEKSDLKGISFIKAVYKLKKGIIEVYIDEEYHKIYDFIIPFPLYQIQKVHVQVQKEKAKKFAGTVTYTDVYSKDEYVINTYYDDMVNLLEYYDYNASGSILLSKYIDNVFYNGVIEFDDGTAIETGKWNYIETSGTEYYHIGINLKYKL